MQKRRVDFIAVALLILALASVISLPWVIKATTEMRGYVAVGGEYALPIIAVLMCFFYKSVRDDLKEERTKES